ncbi:hypothetical protein QE250_14765 [Chromatiaceae bacterium AAb-1]|nr:hypothetical protein [Chromatiaceae bacterium AAb-1]
MKALLSFSLSMLAAAGVVMADPTRPAAGWENPSDTTASARKSPPLHLQLIKQTDAGPVAMINGQLLKPGEFYNEFKIVRIDTSTVTIQQGTGYQTLNLLNTTIKHYD